MGSVSQGIRSPPPPVERTGPGYLTVVAAAVDVEVAAPDGRRTSTATHADSAARIPDSDGAVDCGGVEPRHSAEFSVSVTPDGASQRSKPQ